MFVTKKVSLPFYELGMIGATRGLLGLGIGLLIGEHLERNQRQILGTALTLIGVLSTLPLGIDVLSKAGVFEHRSKDEPDFNRLSQFAGRTNCR